MECRGKITKIEHEFFGPKEVFITLSLSGASVQKLHEFKSLEELSITIKRYRQKRSLDANAYCWVLCGKIADLIGSSKDEVYEEMLQRYGYYYEDDDGYVPFTVRSSADISKFDGHWKFIRDSGEFKTYLKIRGSSEYDSAEMAHFIDSIVLEAKELGIQTETPDEIERMKSLWKGDVK